MVIVIRWGWVQIDYNLTLLLLHTLMTFSCLNSCVQNWLSRLLLYLFYCIEYCMNLHAKLFYEAIYAR